jgi:hypothetical protein
MYVQVNQNFPKTAQNVALKFILYILYIFCKGGQDSLIISGHYADYKFKMCKMSSVRLE